MGIGVRGRPRNVFSELTAAGSNAEVWSNHGRGVWTQESAAQRHQFGETSRGSKSFTLNTFKAKDELHT